MASATPLVSVCIRSHNRPAGLQRAIQSVLRQSYDRFEVVVSDDTGAGAFVRSLSDPRIRYHRAPTGAGPTGNLRSALERSRGAVLAFLDDDDTWHPQFLARTVGSLAGDPSIGVAFTNFRIVVGDRRLPVEIPVQAGRRQPFLNEMLACWPVLPSAAVVRREVWAEGERELPLIDEALGASTIWLRAAAANWAFYYLDEPLVERGMDPRQVSWANSTSRREIATLERFRFADVESERLRRARLAVAYLRAARRELSHGHLRLGWRDLARGRNHVDGRLTASHWLALSGLRELVARSTMRWPGLYAVLRRVRLRRRSRSLA